MSVDGLEHVSVLVIFSLWDVVLCWKFSTPFTAMSVYLVVFLLFAVLVVGDNFVVVEALPPSNVSCGSVRTKYHGTGLQDQIPMIPVSGQSLEICEVSEVTCCTPSVESSLSVQSRKQFDDALAERLQPLAQLMGDRRERFDEKFFNLLNYSKDSFDKMFRKTYGIIYLQNARVFDDLYTSLESYYRTGKPEISRQLDDFFKKFYQKMFVVYNSQYTFSEQYLSCVLTYMDTLQPFGDVPAKFGSSISRSFVALRTFVRGLNISSSVVTSLLKVNPSKSCVRELMKLTHCSTCQGLPDVRPCLPYCLHVHTHCLHHLHQFTTDWKNFVDAMVTVGDRLLNLFNIETVVRPINLQISDAVMNFQLAGMNISNMIFQGCGPPSLGRMKRDASTPIITTPLPQILPVTAKLSDEGQRVGPNGRRRFTNNGERNPNFNGPRREGRRRIASGAGGENGGQRPRGRRPNGRGGRRRLAGGRRGGVGAVAATNDRELSLEKLDFSKKEELPPSINKIIKEIKTKLENSRQFLEEVSPQLCGELASKQDSSCWSGTQLGRSADAVLPQLPVPPPHSGVHDQTYKLQVITRHLQAAANGQDIAWMEEQRINDGTVNDIDGSGSDGSGDWDDIDREDSHRDNSRDGNENSSNNRNRNDRGRSNDRGRGGSRSRQPENNRNFPPDDEDGYTFGGSGDGSDYGRPDVPPNHRGGAVGGGKHRGGGMGGSPPSRGGGSRYDDPYDGSGDHYYNVNMKPNYPHNNRPPYDPNTHHPPSGVAKEDMSLTKAITVYLIPAILMYFGSIG